MQKLSITCTNGGQIVVEGVSYVLVIYLPVCFRIVNPRGKLDSVLPRCSAKTEGRARILIPATTAILTPNTSSWTRLEALADCVSCGLRRFGGQGFFEALGQLLLLVRGV